jgi:hypothetical protein
MLNTSCDEPEKLWRAGLSVGGSVAVQFYLGHGWQIAREFAHEKYHHAMLELAKSWPDC